jgi:hypothetical protein
MSSLPYLVLTRENHVLQEVTAMPSNNLPVQLVVEFPHLDDGRVRVDIVWFIAPVDPASRLVQEGYEDHGAVLRLVVGRS